MAVELWGGAECTVNRVADRFGDQLCATGHDERAGDMDLLASLGVSAVRFPVLWERVSPDGADGADWSWSDARLLRLRELKIRPIIGLVHHGSGPRYTSLLDDGFAPGLALHALAAAQRYPWCEEWTPVNEPMTTARFAALYGHWYPHAHDERLFWTAVVNQVDAIRLSMQAIRSLIPTARLIQTDDLGRTYATAAMADQAAFDNVRRWAAWDLLCGRLVPGHDLWQRLVDHGLEDRLRAIADAPCPPDFIGINHYLTSDRFLDHRRQRYPAHTHGGNGLRAYADLEAVRVLQPGPGGIKGAILDAWNRYRLPVALTEVHNGCTREEQLRWFRHGWDSAHQARAAGADVRAVTAWALFGSQGWNTLLTDSGAYEAGAFDVSGGSVRPTAMARLVSGLAHAEASLPIAKGEGWWERPIRFLHPPTSRPAPLVQQTTSRIGKGHAPVLIIGATGTLGRALAAACRHRGLANVLTGRGELDLLDPASMAAVLDEHRPWAVINAAGWVRVDEAEDDPLGCVAANAHGAVALARSCELRGLPTLNFSSDLVFDGAKQAPYCESDSPAPLNVYGLSKAAMEGKILGLSGEHLIVRTAAFFSPFDPANFAVHCISALSEGRPFVAASDCVVTPTYVPDLCNAALDLLIDAESGLWHLSNSQPVSWSDFALTIADACRLDGRLIEARSQDEMGWRARRPASCGLHSERSAVMPGLEPAVRHFAETVRQAELNFSLPAL